MIKVDISSCTKLVHSCGCLSRNCVFSSPKITLVSLSSPFCSDMKLHFRNTSPNPSTWPLRNLKHATGTENLETCNMRPAVTVLFGASELNKKHNKNKDHDLLFTPTV